MSLELTKTAIKALKRQSKEKLVATIMEMAAYAEQQKAANIILMNAMDQIKKNRAAELETASKETENESK